MSQNPHELVEKNNNLSVPSRTVNLDKMEYLIIKGYNTTFLYVWSKDTDIDYPLQLPREGMMFEKCGEDFDKNQRITFYKRNPKLELA